LNMEVSFLSRSGSGIRFHIDQLLCSDIRKNDIVILQKSSLYRYDYFPSTTRTPVGENLYHINLQACYPLFETIFPVDRLDEQDQIEKTIRGFVKLQNFCRKVQAKLIIWNHFFDDEPLLSFLRTQEDFVDMPFGDFIDVAEVDKDWPGIMDHPGPKQHQAYADFLYEKLK